MPDPEGSSPKAPSRDPSAAARSLGIAMVEQGNALRQQGRIAEAMARYDAAILADPQCAPAHLNRANVLHTSNEFEQARQAYERAIAADPRYAAAHFNLGNLNYRIGEFAAALRNYEISIRIGPFADAFIGMANALAAMGRTIEARQAYEHALTLNPGHPEAHFNLGVLLMAQGLSPQAVASLGRAIDLRPDHAAAHRLLGAALHQLGDLDGAEASLRRALSLDPQASDVAYDLAAILQYRGRFSQALGLLAPLLQRAPSWATRAAFASCAANVAFTAAEPPLRAAMTRAIAEGWAMPQDLCGPALSLLMLDQKIAACVQVANESWPARPPAALLYANGSLAVLEADSLLHALLDATPISSLQFERFLTCARSALLASASNLDGSAAADAPALTFQSALARQCFINEYVFDCPDGERLAAEACRNRLLALLDQQAAVPSLLLVAVAAYFPLFALPGAGRLLAASAAGPIDAVLRQQIREPLAEQALRASIPRLTRISSTVSRAVREQYEQNPYPRWTRMQRHENPLPFNVELRRILPLAQLAPLSQDAAPEVLIAGCGTGRDAIAFAQRVRGARVLAIDLSLSSLCYAKRKSEELGLSGIEYAQGDILGLDEIARSFDVIQAVGVLHHLADPFEGWRMLLPRLRSGGFMCVGLYSQTARRPVLTARQFIAARGYAATSEGIRRFRQDALAADASPELRLLSNSRAFYSSSECRDLAFHVQEHQLTLEQIASFLAEAGLRFVGFELDLRVLNGYRQRFSDDPFCTSLGNWSRFEAENPETFAGMYQFWVQR